MVVVADFGKESGIDKRYTCFPYLNATTLPQEEFVDAGVQEVPVGATIPSQMRAMGSSHTGHVDRSLDSKDRINGSLRQRKMGGRVDSINRSIAFHDVVLGGLAQLFRW